MDVSRLKQMTINYKAMRKTIPWMLAAILTLCGTGLQAQTKRSDDFRARYELKEVVVMSRHNIRSPLTSGAAYQRVTPYEWFKWSSPGSQLSLRGGVLETEMGQLSIRRTRWTRCSPRSSRR